MKLTLLEHLKSCADASMTFFLGLIGELAETVTGVMEEMDTVKADKVTAMSITIPASGWNSDNTVTGYPQYYDLAVDGITAKDRAEITIAPGSIDTAQLCGMCTVNESMDGKIRIRASSVPTATIDAECWIEKGAE